MKAVIFDMDGVLLDSEPLYDASDGAFARDLGFKITPDIFEEFRGTTSPHFWSHLRQRFHLRDDVETLVMHAGKRYRAYLQSLPALEPMPGVAMLLQTLSERNITMAVASSSPMETIHLVLEKFSFEAAFHTIVSGDDIERSKPAPDIFLLAAKQLGLSPKECIVIEDSRNGVLAAKAAGMYCLGFAGSQDHQQDVSGADCVIRSFPEWDFTNFFA